MKTYVVTVGDDGQIVLIADDQGVRLHMAQRRPSRLDAWLGAAPSGGDRGELVATRHAGMDETELRIFRAGPGARVTRIEVVLERPSEGETDQASKVHHPFLNFLGAARLPEGMSTEAFMRETRGDPDPVQKAGPGDRVMPLEDHLKRNS